MTRHAILALAALLLAGSPAGAADVPLSSGYTAPRDGIRGGLWWNPELSGSGMDINRSGERLFLIWYTYEQSGVPVWYLAEADFDGDTWIAPLQRYAWDAETGAATPSEVGEVALDFHGPASATFDWELHGDSGSYAIEPFLVNEGISVYDRTGTWYPTGEPGYGLSLNTQGSVEFAVAYLYDASGEPRWLWSERTGELRETHELVMFEGACPACDYQEPVPTAAGSLKREFSGPYEGTLTLDATFPDPVDGEWQRTQVPIGLLSEPQDGRSHPAAMARFASAEALETYLKRAMAENPPFSRAPGGGPVFSPAPPEAPRHSQTTVQEEGVDEADTIKTDGRILYTVDYAEGNYGVRVLELDPEAPGITELTRIDTDIEDLSLRAMYLAKGREASDPDLLVGLFHRQVEGLYNPPWHDPSDWVGEKVEVRVWNVDEPANPVQAFSVGLDGGLVQSRRIGDTLYLVSRHTPTPPEGLVRNPDDEAVDANLALLEDVSLEDLLPDLRVDGDKVGELVNPADTWLPPVLLEKEEPNLVSVSAIDLRATDPGAGVMTVVGQTEAIYVSTENLYLASTRYEYLTDLANFVMSYPSLVYTDIHKTALTDESPAYRGSASVEGHLGYLQDRKPFRMGEYRGMLGMVTSSPGMWGNLGDHRLTMLRETPRTKEHRLLREAAHLPNPDRPKTLGKPDENLYATRFLGDRLYVVTFKKVDPLYVVDLSNPADPAIAGEVELSGYSDFLYPVGDEMLVGIGLDAVPAEGPGDGRFAWYQGVKLGLFDVSDPANPTELDSLVLGRRGTRSPALAEHHAFSFLPEGNGLPARFAIPVRLHDAWTQDDISPEPNHSYPWVRSGLFLFNVLDGDVHPKGLVHSGTVVTTRRPQDEPHDHHAYFHNNFARSVIMDESVFFVHDGDVWPAKWRAPAQAAGPQ